MADPITNPNARGPLVYDNCRTVMPPVETKKTDEAEKVVEVKVKESSAAKNGEKETKIVDQTESSEAVWDFADRYHCWTEDALLGLENSCARFGLYPYAD